LKVSHFICFAVLAFGVLAGCKTSQPEKPVDNPLGRQTGADNGVLIQKSSGNCSPNISGVSGETKVDCPGDKGKWFSGKRRRTKRRYPGKLWRQFTEHFRGEWKCRHPVQ